MYAQRSASHHIASLCWEDHVFSVKLQSRLFHAQEQSKQTPKQTNASLSAAQHSPAPDSLFAPRAAPALCLRSFMNLAIHLIKNETLSIAFKLIILIRPSSVPGLPFERKQIITSFIFHFKFWHTLKRMSVEQNGYLDDHDFSLM